MAVNNPLGARHQSIFHPWGIVARMVSFTPCRLCGFKLDAFPRMESQAPIDATAGAAASSEIDF